MQLQPHYRNKKQPYDSANISQKSTLFKKYVLIILLSQAAILCLFATAVVAPLVYSLKTSPNGVNTTTVTTTTATTVTTTTATTSTSTSTSTTTRQLVWNITSYTVAGNANGVAGSNLSLLFNPMGITLDSSNALYIAELQNHRITRWIQNAGIGTIVAGQPNRVSGATNNTLNSPFDVILDSNNNMYISDQNNHRVMFWAYNASFGTVVAGVTGSPGNGNNQLSFPAGLSLDSSTGTLYIADTNNHRVMRYLSGATSGTIVAGGNGGGTSSTQLYSPYSVQFQSSTNSLIIVNNGAHNVVRWVLGASSWTIVAGSSSGTSGNTATLLQYPHNAVIDPYGNTYVSDTSNHRIQLFLPGQLNGTTVAGSTGLAGNNATLLNQPYWTILDSQLGLYVADTNNNRIQKDP